jgi:hypothetical protein
MTAGLGRIMAYQRPFRDRVARSGLLAVAPVSVAFLLLTLVVSALWHDPAGGHRAVTACCAWRATDLPRGSLLPLLGSAVLVRRPVEAAWTVAATWLVLGPLEAVIGSRRVLAVAILGHAIPTVLIDLCWLAGARAGRGLAGLDVGTSAVVVTAAAALAVSTGSLPVAAVLAACLAVDIAAAPDLATAEHLVAVAIGIGGALALRLWPRPRHDRPAGWRSALPWRQRLDRHPQLIRHEGLPGCEEAGRRSRLPWIAAPSSPARRWVQPD